MPHAMMSVHVVLMLVLPLRGLPFYPLFVALQDGQQVVMKTITRTKLTDKDRQEVRTLLLLPCHHV